MSDTPTPIEQLLNIWDEDSTMDSTEPGKELLKIPKLHAKYIRIRSKYSMRVRQFELDLASVRKRKYDYYSGRLSQEELDKYGLKQFKFVLKGEVREYVDSDPEVTDLLRKKSANEELVHLSDSILKELNNRGYALKAYIDWEKFIGGQ